MSATLVHHPITRTTLTPPQSPTSELDLIRPSSAPIPNKHLPFCPAGPLPEASQQNPTPPASPPTKSETLQTFSLLHPADTYLKVLNRPPVYSIDASTLAAATKELAGQLLPDPKLAFPWLHGLHVENQVQLAFFIARRRSLRNTPKCFRGITIVKAGQDLSRSKLKGAVSEDEVLNSGQGRNACFLDVDPRDGFSVRNFQIQVAKMATVSDIVVYAEDRTREKEMLELAERIAFAQNTWRVKNSTGELDAPIFNTFILSSSFEDVESQTPELVAVDSHGQTTGNVIDFFQWERQEMCNMSKSSEIARNVWLGPTPDSILCPPTQDDPTFDIFIDTNDLAQPPDHQTLERVAQSSHSAPQHIEFPSSGSVISQTGANTGSESLIRMCQWMHQMATSSTSNDNEEVDDNDSEGDIPMRVLNPPPRKILIHCTDGYTESSLLALAYYMYAERLSAHEAWLGLHCDKKRNFFAYPSDVTLLSSLHSSIVPTIEPGSEDRAWKEAEPTWISRIDGSLPSRILPYMYLGNLGHANNPDLLKAMGIRRILSVGESANWTQTQLDDWGVKNLLFVDRVQDNGVDPLTEDFERCLKFISKGREDGSATLVHCRVGVSRSATICIAEVMSTLGLSFPRAYCYVRARRLNVIIQPHLRFAYELLKWDEVCQQKRGEAVRREMEWATIAREIAAMNKPYASR